MIGGENLTITPGMMHSYEIAPGWVVDILLEGEGARLCVADQELEIPSRRVLRLLEDFFEVLTRLPDQEAVFELLDKVEGQLQA